MDQSRSLEDGAGAGSKRSPAIDIGKRSAQLIFALGIVFIVWGLTGLSHPFLEESGPDVTMRSVGAVPGEEDPTEWQAMMAGMGFHLSYEGAVAEALDRGSPILLYAGSPTCHWCRRFHENILTDEGVQKSMDSYVSLAVQYESGSPLLDRYRIRGTPSVVLIDPGTGREFFRLTGYPNPETVRAPASYFAELLDGARNEWVSGGA